MKSIPLSLQQANEYISKFHRHHKPVHRDKYRVGAIENNKIIGIVQVGRPVARGLDDGQSLEVVRLCTDGTKNACSFLYSKAARIAKELGYKKIYTYILENESGASLKATGWTLDGVTAGGSWDTPSRRRKTEAPTCKKLRYLKRLEVPNGKEDQ